MALMDIFKRNKKAKKKREFTAGKFGRLFNDWKATNQSPNEELKGNLQTIRDRARDLERNNPIIQRYFQLLKQGVVGVGEGFKIKVRARNSNGDLDSPANDLIERKWYEWCENPDISGRYNMHDLYQMVMVGLVRDGETFTQFIRSKDGFKLNFLEPDYIDSDLNKDISDKKEIRMGVEIEKRSMKPTAYYLKANPYSDILTNVTNVDKNIRLPADDALHLFDSHRFGQVRGYPRIANVMTAIKWLQDFRYSELIASKSAAAKMAFLKTPTGDNYAEGYLDDDNAYMPTMDFSPGTIEMLPEGYDIEFMDNKHPNTNVDQYDKSMIRTIASGLGVSYASLSNYLSQTSYSSSRVGLLDERDYYKQNQSWLIHHFCIPIYREWLKHNLTIGTLQFNNGPIKLQNYDKFAYSCSFIPRGYSWIDPQKEIQASQMALNNGLMTMQDVLNQYGKELGSHFSELDAEKALADRFKIELAFQPFGTKFNTTTGEVYDQGPVNNQEGEEDA